MRFSLRHAAAVLALLAAGALGLSAQGFRRGSPGASPDPNIPYDGRFTFVRIRFEPMGGGSMGFRQDLKWDHDYPRAERHFTTILRELTRMRPYQEGGNVLALDDPELFKYPVAYLCEPGFWTATPAEAEGLRNYLLKGGFLIVDDFAGPGQWDNFEQVMRVVLPQARLVPLDVSHPVFDAFFHIESIDYMHPYFGLQSQFFGVFEDNDPDKRLMMIVNFNNDIGDYWEWSDEGLLPLQMSNEAYKLGVNYVMYAMTH